jgi:hypothetical protein
VLRLAGLDDLIHDGLCHVDGDREPDALVAAAFAGENRGIDADQLAAGIDEGAARVARIDGASVWMKSSKRSMPSPARPVALTMPMVTV